MINHCPLSVSTSVARFREGRESASDNPRNKRPVASVNDENIEKDVTPVRTRFMVFVHNNAHPHTANIVKQFLTKRSNANGTSTILARFQSSRYLPIPTTESRFERKEI
ncbi:hypothetical protein TNCV_1337051 [Trichonephila clavipes]|nr:hypothetical protein TNCV_1337051 [Trichonephila clavipes]